MVNVDVTSTSLASLKLQTAWRRVRGVREGARRRGERDHAVEMDAAITKLQGTIRKLRARRAFVVAIEAHRKNVAAGRLQRTWRKHNAASDEKSVMQHIMNDDLLDDEENSPRTPAPALVTEEPLYREILVSPPMARLEAARPSQPTVATPTRIKERPASPKPLIMDARRERQMKEAIASGVWSRVRDLFAEWNQECGVYAEL